MKWRGCSAKRSPKRKHADQLLTQIAESNVNRMAA